jgi:hypothetical protein
MPYITKTDRAIIEDTDIANFVPANGGELQYVIALFVEKYIKSKGLRYQYCQDIMGALAGAQMEFYRKVVGPYEEQKIAENGGVYSEVGANKENSY